MPYYRRRYSRAPRRAYRRYRRSSYGRARRVANMNFSAMQSMRDISRFCLKYRRDLTINIPTG